MRLARTPSDHRRDEAEEVEVPLENARHIRYESLST